MRKNSQPPSQTFGTNFIAPLKAPERSSPFKVKETHQKSQEFKVDLIKQVSSRAKPSPYVTIHHDMKDAQVNNINDSRSDSFMLLEGKHMQDKQF